MKKIASLKIGRSQIALLERLSNAAGVSGDEGQVRKIVVEELKKAGLPWREDAIGNILVEPASKASGKLRVMLDAHMDEVGFMIVEEDAEGLLRFESVGGIDERVLPGKAVLVGKNLLPGVIGAKPIHLTQRSELEQKIPLESLRIDVGANGPKVKAGDRAIFATQFRRIGPSLVGKALDDRIGVVLVLELLKAAPENLELVASFSVQEEIGLRGARVAGYTLKPDLAIALDSTPAYDLTVWDESENTTPNTRLGKGPAIYVADGSTLGDPRLIRHFVSTAAEWKLPYQIRQPGGGGTDAGGIHLARGGVPSISISVPSRYAHSAASVARLSDFQAALDLLWHGLSQLDPSILAQPR